MRFLRATAGSKKGMKEGCGLVECLERGNECINQITTDEAFSACRDILESEVHKQLRPAHEVALASGH